MAADRRPTSVRRFPARTKAPHPASHLERELTWHGLRPGEAVEISGVAGRGLRFEFRAYVSNARSGDSWVEVVGGRPGERAIRSFRPDQVFPEGARRRGSPSLKDAPRLPFS